MKNTMRILLLVGLPTVICLLFSGCFFVNLFLPDEGFEFYLNENGTGYCADYWADGLNTPEEIVIPSQHDGLPVTELAEYCFWGCYSTEKIVIPPSVTKIGAYAFAECYALRELTIPKSVTEIDICPVSSCTALSSLTVEEGNPSYKAEGNCLIDKRSGTLIGVGVDAVLPDDGSIRKIGNDVFFGLPIREIVIPEGVAVIGETAFNSCTALESVTLPRSLRYIGSAAFAYCESLASVDIPAGVVLVEYGAFMDCPSLKTVRMGEGISAIGAYAFSGAAIEQIYLPAGISVMGERVFDGCKALTRISCGDASCPEGWDPMWGGDAVGGDRRVKLVWGVKNGNAEAA